MPRIPFSLIKYARHIDPLLVLLLRECRELRSARNELRWLREYARTGGGTPRGTTTSARVRKMVRQRAKGVPLQYILGDQPFGELDILCRKGVLIPRPETETYTYRIAQRIMSSIPSRAASNREFRILDLCTGTGCIPLLLHSLLAPSIPKLKIIGVDISPTALALSKENLEHNIQSGKLLGRARDEVSFIQANVLDSAGNVDATGIPSLASELAKIDIDTASTPSDQPVGKWDLLISNPPYISPLEFRNGTTRRSVRLYEPALALVPPPLSLPKATTAPLQGNGASSSSSKCSEHTENRTNVCLRQDLFYPKLLEISSRIGAEFTVLECGDPLQAQRVAKIADERQRNSMLQKEGGEHTSVSSEIWNCDGEDEHSNIPKEGEVVGGAEIPTQGACAVVVRRQPLSE